jgi:transposase
MRLSLKLKPIRGRQLNRLREMYDQARYPRLRRRAQTVLLAQAGYEAAEIAQITRQSCWTVRRWLHRFMAEGCEGLWEGLRSGRPPQITAVIELFLREALGKSPRDYGLARPNWTTALLSIVIKRRFKCEASDECVRHHLHDVDGVCRRPTWTVRHRAEAQPGYAQKKAQLQGC